MKKLFNLVFTAVFMLLAVTSCSQEEDFTQSSQQTTSFNISLNGAVGSRAIGKGTYANKLYYEVFMDGGSVDKGEVLFSAGPNHNLDLPLLNGETYSIVFWAQNSNCSIYNLNNLSEIKVNYDNDVLANQESYDAFYNALVNFKADGNTHRVELRRPFAQLNLGTGDWDKVIVPDDADPVTVTSVKVEGLADTFAPFTGVASNPVTKTFDYNALPEGTFKVNNKEYKYLSLNYLLVPGKKEPHGTGVYVAQTNEDKATLNLTFNLKRGDKVLQSISVPNAPLQRNWRTNIIGDVLTGTDFDIEINPDYDEPDYEVLVWDGSEVKEPKVSGTDNNIYEIEYASELAWLAAAVNGTLTEGQRSAVAPNDFAGKTFKLIKDIDLGGHEWTPIGYVNKYFRGTFDGQEHTISNFKITKKRNKDIHQAAFIGAIAGNATLKNFTINHVQILYPGVEAGDFYGAAVVGTVYGNHTFENIKVTNSKIQGNNKVAGLIAHDGSSTSIKITNCHVSNCTLESKNEEDGGNVGGMVGYLATNGVVISNSSVKNCTINAINSLDEGKRGNSQFIGAIHGEKSLTIENCAIEGNTFTETGLNTYVSPYDVNFIGGAREAATADVFINGIRYVRLLPESINLDEESIILKSLEANHGVTLSGTGILILDDVTITAETGSAITLAEGANVTLQIVNNVNLTGATNGIEVAEGRILTVKGTGNLTTNGIAGSGIGVKGANAGSINIDEIAHITAKGNGDHAFGIGGNGATVVIKNSTVDYACGGHIQPLFVNDEKYGKSEPEGGAGIGGATIQIDGSTITKVNGGSKAAAIGARFWQSTNIVIKNSTIAEANGGNASAGIGGSRYDGESKYKLSIKIENSTITATGGQGGAGIGSGYDTHCNGQNYDATNYIEIDGASTITATGGKYAAGIGTGFHSAYLSGSIAEGANITAMPGEKVYKEEYSTAQNIGYGVVDPAREFSGDNRTVTFTVNGTLIECPVQFPVAKVGDTEYKSIDEAIDNWTNNTILTLLGDVTLTDVIKLKSTEHHILDLGTFTMTGASGKNAIEIINEGRSSASYALDIKADATNPGGITASSAIVKTTGKSGVKDRPIICFYNGVFNANNIINHRGSNGTNSPQFIFYNGVYNGNITTDRAICIFEGGTFNGRFYMSVDSSSYARIGGGKFKELNNNYGSALNADKFTIGSSKGVFDRGVYVDDEGYFVVGGPVIKEFGDKFAAKATNASKVGSYLPYSSAATEGLYYTNAQMAIDNHGETNVELKK